MRRTVKLFIISATLIFLILAVLFFYKSANKQSGFVVSANIVEHYNDVFKSGDKAVVMIGDSYGIKYVNENDEKEGWNGWADSFKTMFPDAKVYTSAVGRAAFVGNKTTVTFEMQLDDLIETIDDKDNITDVVLIGGYNDMFNTEDRLYEAVSNFRDKVKDNFPNAKISMMYVAADYRYGDRKRQLKRQGVLFKELCDKYDIVFVENSDKVLNNKNLMYFYGDDANGGFHPNNDGCDKIAFKTAEYLVTGAVSE